MLSLSEGTESTFLSLSVVLPDTIHTYPAERLLVLCCLGCLSNQYDNFIRRVVHSSKNARNDAFLAQSCSHELYKAACTRENSKNQKVFPSDTIQRYHSYFQSL